MAEDSTAVPTHIITIDPGGPMSTLWSFTYKSSEGTGVFHADWRCGRAMAEGLAYTAAQEATALGISIPANFSKGALVCAMDVELVPDDCMGMAMPSVNPVGLNVERLQAMITKATEAIIKT